MLKAALLLVVCLGCASCATTYTTDDRHHRQFQSTSDRSFIRWANSGPPF